MKTNTFALCSLLAAVCLSGYRSAYSDEALIPAPTPVEAVPAIPAVKSDPLTPRQEVALNATIRLDQLDEAVAELKVRCDEKSTCLSLAPDFKKVGATRLNVLSALANLRDPEIGFEATATGVRDSLSELDVAIQALVRKVALLSEPVTSLSTRPATIIAERELAVPTR